MEKISLEGSYRKICKHNCVHKEIKVGRWTFRLNKCSPPSVYFEGPNGIKGFLSLSELRKFKEIMERIKSARKELNRFPFPRYAHEVLMDILDSLNLGDVHE